MKMHVYLYRTEEFIRKGVFKTSTNNLELILPLSGLFVKFVLVKLILHNFAPALMHYWNIYSTQLSLNPSPLENSLNCIF